MRRLLLVLLLPFLLARPALAQDEPGILARFLQDNLSAAGREVRVTGFRGALSSLAQIDQITVADDQGIWLTLRGIALDWNRLAVLRGEFSVNNLTAEEIIVARRPVPGPAAPPSPEARGFALPDLPISVDIGRIAANRVELGAPVLGEPLTATVEASLRLAGGEGETDLHLSRLDDGPSTDLTLRASYANASRQLVVDLEAKEEAGGIVSRLAGLPGAPATELTVKGEGIVDDFTAAIRLATDGTERLAGTVRLAAASQGGMGFSARLGGDIAPLFLPDYAGFFGNDVALAVTGTRGASGALDLSQLSLRTEALSLDGAMRLAADGLPEVLKLTGSLGHADGARVLLPTPGEDRIYVQRADVTLDFDALNDDGWSAMVTLAGLDHPAAKLGQALLSGSGRIGRGPLGRTVGGTVRLLAADLQPTDPALAQALGSGVTATSRFAWQEGQPLSLSDLMLAGSDYTATLRGKLTGLTEGIGFDGQVSLQAQDLARFSGLAQRPLGGAARLDGIGKGSLLGGDFDLEATVAGDGLSIGQPQVDNLLRGQTQLVVSAARSATGTEIRQLDLTAATLSVAARGTLRTAGSDLTADLDFADLTVLGDGFGGRLTARAQVSGTMQAGSLTLDGTGRDLLVGQPLANGLLRGETQLSVALRAADGAVLVDKAVISNPQVSADVTGRVQGAGTDLSGTVSLSGLDSIGPSFGGSLTAKGRVTGTLEAGSLVLDARASDLSVGQPAADGFLRGQSTLSLALRTEGGAVLVDRATIANPQVDADVTGRWQAEDSDLSGRVALRNLSALGPGFGGSLSGTGRVTGTLDTGSLTLDATASGLRLGQPQADRLLAGQSTLALALRTESGAIRVDRAVLTNPQLSVNATGRAEGNSRNVTLEARLANLGLLLPEFPGPLTVTGTASDRGNGYDLDLRGQGPGQIDARVSGRLASNLRSADLAIRGTAQAALANAFIAPQQVAGAVQLDLRLNGPLALNALSGRATLSGGRVAIPAAPFALKGVTATADLSGGTARVTVDAGATSGGSLGVAGTVGLAAPFNGDLRVSLRDMTLRDPDLYEMQVQGQLQVTGPLAGGALIAGAVNIPEAEFRVPSTGIGGTAAIPDLTQVNTPPAVQQTLVRAGLVQTGTAQRRAPSRPYQLDVTVSAPNQIYLRGRGLDAELGGSLRIGGTTTAVAPSGQISLIRGRLDILGRRLTLDEAQITLGGSLDATLNIVASNSSDGVTSYVTISGPISEPVVSFTSQPPLPDEEVLARLLFGRNLQSLSPFQAAQLASAVGTLAGRGGEGVIARLRKGFGLDDLDIVAGENGNASLMFGRYISDEIYSEVVVGSGGTTELRLNFDIRPGVVARAIAGSDGQTGIGIYVDRDY